jgi:hypothetical protein
MAMVVTMLMPTASYLGNVLSLSFKLFRLKPWSSERGEPTFHGIVEMKKKKDDVYAIFR